MVTIQLDKTHNLFEEIVQIIITMLIMVEIYKFDVSKVKPELVS